VQEQFVVDLARPRDINSVDLAKHATEITRALKRHLHPGVEEEVAE
jgi:NitT/TauT family transport system ATP-binding protein